MAKCAVLVGCNYPGTDNQLQGCVGDVIRMRSYLVELFGFAVENINLLIDTDDSYPQPTGANIRQALADMVASAEPAGYLYFHFSGHGCRVPPGDDVDDETGYDECICPSDMNLIHDDEFKELVNQLPEGCRLTVVSDSCHSGGLIDKTKEQIGESTKFHEDPDAPPPENKEEEPTEAFDEEAAEPEEQANEEEPTEAFDEEAAEPEEQANEEEPTEAFDEEAAEPEEQANEEEQEAEQDEEEPVEEYGGAEGNVKNRAISLSDLVEIIRQKTGNEDLEAANIRHALFDVFGEEASPVLFGGQRLSGGGSRGGEGILISGCQSFQLSQDIGGEEPFGLLSGTILAILEESKVEISNRELVLRLRKTLADKGFNQRPGLYCSDEYVDEPFICPL